MSSLIPSILGLAVLVLAASSAQGLSMPHNLWYERYLQKVCKQSGGVPSL